MRDEALTWAGVCGLLTLILFWIGQRKLRMKRLIQDIPTSKAAGVCIGLSEIKGKAECEAPLTSYLAEAEVVHYSWNVQEHWRRIETYTDSKGRTQIRVVSGWTTVASGGEQIPFDLRDTTGAVRVEPVGADVEGQSIFSRTVSIEHPLYYGKGPGGGVPYSTFTRSFSETAIVNGAQLYILGSARLRTEVAAPVITQVKSEDPYLISVRSEEQIVRGKAWGTALCHIGGLLGAMAIGAILDTTPTSTWELEASSTSYRVSRESNFGDFLAAHWRGLLLGALCYGALLTAGWMWLIHNGLVRLRNRLHSAWSLVDVQLKRRHDLIPNLVKVVQGSQRHEKDLQTLIAEARTAAADARSNGDNLSEIKSHGGGLVKHLVAVREAYPDLGANANFSRLMDQLIDTEDRIALATQFSNDCLTNLRNRMETIPDLFVVKLARFSPEKRGWYNAAPTERAVPSAELTASRRAS
ncbi:MAG: LemA domain-containing protein [Planctomycetes bacterium]|nr:LemA domain-containing protein [Planctomycetota bacterium]